MSVHRRNFIILKLILLASLHSKQLSNEPAEELANYVVASRKGAFKLVGYVSGGAYIFDRIHPARTRSR